jgi:hypothetical protein
VIFGNPTLDRNKLFYKCKISWNIIVKGIKILVLKGFSIVYEKSMVGGWYGTLVIHK